MLLPFFPESWAVTLTNDGLFEVGIHRQDVFLHQLHGAGSLGYLLVQVVGQPSPLQSHLGGL